MTIAARFDVVNVRFLFLLIIVVIFLDEEFLGLRHHDILNLIPNSADDRRDIRTDVGKDTAQEFLVLLKKL